MVCIGTGKMVADERRMRYTPELYFKSADEMRALFPDHPEAISNTLEIADRINLALEFGVSKYPEYPMPEGKTREAYLRELCYKGLRRSLRRTGGNRPGAGQAARLRIGRAGEGRVRQLSPDRLGLHSFREAARDSGRPRPRFGRRFPGRLRSWNYRYRSVAIRAHLRAVPESGTRFAARHRRRFLQGSAWRSARIRSPKIRRSPRLADRDVQQNEREERRARRRAGHRAFLRRGGPARPHDSYRTGSR